MRCTEPIAVSTPGNGFRGCCDDPPGSGPPPTPSPTRTPTQTAPITMPRTLTPTQFPQPRQNTEITCKYDSFVYTVLR